MADLLPTSLKADNSCLVVSWNDGREDRIPYRVLRDCCPCATCKVQRDEKQDTKSDLLPVLSPDEAAPLKLTKMEPMGHYAYEIHFSDGHKSGIYTLTFLRSLGDELHRLSDSSSGN